MTRIVERVRDRSGPADDLLPVAEVALGSVNCSDHQALAATKPGAVEPTGEHAVPPRPDLRRALGAGGRAAAEGQPRARRPGSRAGRPWRRSAQSPPPERARQGDAYSRVGLSSELVGRPQITTPSAVLQWGNRVKPRSQRGSKPAVGSRGCQSVLHGLTEHRLARPQRHLQGTAQTIRDSRLSLPVPVAAAKRRRSSTRRRAHRTPDKHPALGRGAAHSPPTTPRAAFSELGQWARAARSSLGEFSNPGLDGDRGRPGLLSFG